MVGIVLLISRFNWLQCYVTTFLSFMCVYSQLPIQRNISTTGEALNNVGELYGLTTPKSTCYIMSFSPSRQFKSNRSFAIHEAEKLYYCIAKEYNSRLLHNNIAFSVLFLKSLLLLFCHTL